MGKLTGPTKYFFQSSDVSRLVCLLENGLSWRRNKRSKRPHLKSLCWVRSGLLLRKVWRGLRFRKMLETVIPHFDKLIGSIWRLFCLPVILTVMLEQFSKQILAVAGPILV
jgi:hypothetical protein